jgi:hypothetical protein
LVVVDSTKKGGTPEGRIVEHGLTRRVTSNQASPSNAASLNMAPLWKVTMIPTTHP